MTMTPSPDPAANGATSAAHNDGTPGDAAPAAAAPLTLPSPVAPWGGFSAPVVAFPPGGSLGGKALAAAPTTSPLASGPAIETAQMVELSEGGGTLLYYPRALAINVGDVFYLRERDTPPQENGVIVQVIRKETAPYAQADAKALWRLLTAVRASQLARSHHEPPETIDQFLAAKFKVRASIVNGQWVGAEGRVVTRNVDVFAIDPATLTGQILRSEPAIDLHLGDYQSQSVAISGAGFEKVNLITGMKGEGKSHLTKGIIDQSRQRGMSAVVFDINREYGRLPGAQTFTPTVNLKFRLDRLRKPNTFIDVVQRLAPFAERTAYAAFSELPQIMRARTAAGEALDIKFLKDQANVVLPGSATYLDAMRASYRQSLSTIESYDLFATEAEMATEAAALKSRKAAPIVTLSSAFYNLDLAGQAGVIVFEIGGLAPGLQRTVVQLVLDALAELCDRQYTDWRAGNRPVPVYPTVYFEEAHMYMDERDINDIIPLIRHLGMNLFFVTNTPGELPDSVFRLADNLIMTRLLNESDMRKVAMCGLADTETISGFARDLPTHHALLLSGKEGTTRNFPLVFHVRDFELPPSGVSRSMWAELRKVGLTRAGGTAGGNTPGDGRVTRE